MLEEEYVYYEIGILIDYTILYTTLELIIDTCINLIKYSYKALF